MCAPCQPLYKEHFYSTDNIILTGLQIYRRTFPGARQNKYADEKSIIPLSTLNVRNSTTAVNRSGVIDITREPAILPKQELASDNIQLKHANQRITQGTTMEILLENEAMPPIRALPRWFLRKRQETLLVLLCPFHMPHR